MILSASRRTDIPAFYADWFLNRLREGSVLVRNPMNYHQVSEVKLTPENVDCIVFWTKNPSQRSICGCVSSIDIGSFNTCTHGCKYCYANYGKQAVFKNQASHNPNSPLIFGELGEQDVVKPRKEKDVKSLKQPQQSLF